jgi:hypothetical protein
MSMVLANLAILRDLFDFEIREKRVVEQSVAGISQLLVVRESHASEMAYPTPGRSRSAMVTG